MSTIPSVVHTAPTYQGCKNTCSAAFSWTSLGFYAILPGTESHTGELYFLISRHQVFKIHDTISSFITLSTGSIQNYVLNPFFTRCCSTTGRKNRTPCVASLQTTQQYWDRLLMAMKLNRDRSWNSVVQRKQASREKTKAMVVDPC